MKKKFLNILLFIFLILVYYALSFTFFKSNSSALYAFFIISVIYIFIKYILLFLTYLFFSITKKDNKTIKLTIFNFEKKDLNTKTKKALLINLFINLCTYILFYYFNFYIFKLLPINQGIYNSLQYLTKIYLIPISILTFETTYFSYCLFLKTIYEPLKLNCIKYFLYSICTLFLIPVLKIHTYIYIKTSIDILISTYYIIKLRKIILLTKEGNSNEKKH